ncbi:hypothetical protein KKC1_01720 [Calderihabitans maritimus]|uniref:Uncharacterized protein n=1 Tax=Calderihabitans maritimus TaxID=1246530 RepID=A0A1Z5HP05_9FIRM|nr:hypothetical protein KKC1_01720 [Calderihabitans maritimus]
MEDIDDKNRINKYDWQMGGIPGDKAGDKFLFRGGGPG